MVEVSLLQIFALIPTTVSQYTYWVHHWDPVVYIEAYERCTNLEGLLRNEARVED